MIYLVITSSFLLILLLRLRPSIVFSLSLMYPVLSLPIYVLLKREIGLLNIVIEVVAVLALLILVLRRSPRAGLRSLFPIVAVLIFLSTWGLILGQGEIPLTVRLLGIKLLILPFIMGSVARFPGEVESTVISTVLTVQILNVVAAVVETALGVERLQMLGLEYGTNIRNFDTHLRAPGLALTNYQLGCFSAATLVFTYLLLTSQFELQCKIPRGLVIVSGFSAIICLFLSNFRSGIIFSVSAIFICECISRRRLVGSTMILIFGFCSLFIAILSNFYLLDTNSSLERQSKWIELLANYDWKVGAGIGFTGAASLSSYATVGDRIVTDNQFITMMLQYGLIGFLLLAFLLIFLFVKGNAVSKSLVSALGIMMFFVEVLDSTLFLSLCLYLIFRGILKKEKEFLP